MNLPSIMASTATVPLAPAAAALDARRSRPGPSQVSWPFSSSRRRFLRSSGIPGAMENTGRYPLSFKREAHSFRGGRRRTTSDRLLPGRRAICFGSVSFGRGEENSSTRGCPFHAELIPALRRYSCSNRNKGRQRSVSRRRFFTLPERQAHTVGGTAYTMGPRHPLLRSEAARGRWKSGLSMRSTTPGRRERMRPTRLCLSRRSRGMAGRTSATPMR